MTRIPGFRWRIVPAFLYLFFGAATVSGGLVRAGMMSYFYVFRGPSFYKPDIPTTNLFAISARNVFSVVVGLALGAMLLWSGVRFWPSRELRECLP